MTPTQRIFLLITLAAALPAAAPPPAPGADWYVGPKGTAKGEGTRRSPWDLESALLGQQAVKPGDTVYLLAGNYRRRPAELFEVRLAGEKGKPVHVRPAPGE